LGEVFDLNDDYQVKVNMRAGDGINYRIMRVATEGDELIVVAKRGDWTEVKLPTGSSLSAWVKAKYLNVKDKKATVNADQVSLRADRSLQSQVLTSMKNGLELEVEKVDGTWVKVKAPQSTTCWISGKFVRFKEKISGQKDVSSESSETKQDNVVGVTSIKNDATAKSKKIGAVSLNKDSATSKETKKGEGSKPVVSAAEKLKALREKYEDQLETKTSEETRKYKGVSSDYASQYLAVGLVVSIDDNKNKNATHKLEDKKRTQYLMRSAVDKDSKKLFDLNDYSGKKVGISGSVEQQKDGKRIVLVEKITVLN
jgi:SH3-like domain-containing protein